MLVTCLSSLEKMTLQVPDLFKNQADFCLFLLLFCYQVVGIPHIFWILISYQISGLQILSPILLIGCIFHFVGGFIALRTFSVGTVPLV
jgi:hypothetical protein